MTQKLEIFPNYTNSNLQNLGTYKVCDDNELCLMYMFKNGKDIYTELDIYNKLPRQIEHDKITNIFNTNNIVRNNLLNDNYIQSLVSKHNTNTDLIINSILMHLRPLLYNNQTITMTDIDNIKEKVDSTLIFELNYMNTIENQVDFLTSKGTIDHIKVKVNERITDLNIEVKDDYVMKILRHEISNFRSRYGNDDSNKITPVEIKHVYLSTLSKLKPRDIFSIINDVIERIVSDLFIENNMIKNNQKLDRWNTVLGVNNEHGLRRHTNIKLNEKKPKGMLFNMTF